MKKLAIGLATVAFGLSMFVLPVSVSAARRCGGEQHPRRCCREHNPCWDRCNGGGHSGDVSFDNDKVLVVTENYADVDTTSTAIAVSGEVWQSHNDDGNVVHTGPASASTWTETTVNTTVVSINQN